MFNVKDYGAVGDGSSDDSQSLQDAINDLGGLEHAVYFPPGRYRLDSTLVFPKYTLDMAADRERQSKAA